MEQRLIFIGMILIFIDAIPPSNYLKKIDQNKYFTGFIQFERNVYLKSALNLTNSFNDIITHVPIDYFNSSSNVSEVFEPPYSLSTLSSYQDENENENGNGNEAEAETETETETENILDFVFDESDNIILYITKNKIKAIKLINNNSTFLMEKILFQNVDYIFSNESRFISLNMIKIKSKIEIKNEVTLIFLFTETNVFYTKLLKKNLTNLTITGFIQINQTIDFDPEMKIISNGNCIYIPSKAKGLFVYIYKEGMLIYKDTFYKTNGTSNKNGKDTHNILSLIIPHENTYDVFIADADKALHISRIAHTQPNISMINELDIPGKGYSYLSHSNILDHDIVITIKKELKKKVDLIQEYMYYKETQKWEKIKENSVSLNIHSIDSVGQYFIYITNNILGLGKIISSKKYSHIPIAGIKKGSLLKFNNTYYILFLANDEIKLSKIIEPDQLLLYNGNKKSESLSYQTTNISGFTHFCWDGIQINFSEIKECEYIKTFVFNFKTEEKSSSEMYSYFILIIIAIAIIIPLTCGLILVIIFRKYKKVKHEYELIINQEKMRQNTSLEIQIQTTEEKT